MTIVLWFINSTIGRYLLAGGAAVLAILGIYVKGREDEKSAIAEANAEQLKKDTQTVTEVQNEVGNMSDPDLDAALSKFMRDSKK